MEGLREAEKPSFLSEKNLLIKKKVFPPLLKSLNCLSALAVTASETFNAVFLIDEFTLMANGADHFAVIYGRFFFFFGSGGLTGNCGSDLLALFAVNDSEFAEMFFDHITDFSGHGGNIFAFFEVSAVGVVNAFKLIDEESRTRVVTEDGRDESAHSNDP